MIEFYVESAPDLDYMFLKGAGFISLILNEIPILFNEICSQVQRQPKQPKNIFYEKRNGV